VQLPIYADSPFVAASRTAPVPVDYFRVETASHPLGLEGPRVKLVEEPDLFCGKPDSIYNPRPAYTNPWFLPEGNVVEALSGHSEPRFLWIPSAQPEAAIPST
jgi:hypothetical protein